MFGSENHVILLFIVVLDWSVDGFCLSLFFVGKTFYKVWLEFVTVRVGVDQFWQRGI